MQLGGDPEADREHAGGIIYPIWPLMHWEHPGSVGERGQGDELIHLPTKGYSA